MIRVVIADDHHLVREGVRALLDRTDDMEVVAEAEDGGEAVELVQRLKPDVLLMDITMPRVSGIEALRRLQSLETETQIVMLSMHADEVLGREAVRYGACCYLVKGPESEELLIAIRAAYRGGAYFSPGVSGSVVAEGRNYVQSSTGEQTRKPLTEREREVLHLIAEGMTNKEISEHMHVSIKTVERHRSQLMAKLGAHNLVELIRAGVKVGLITLDR